MSTPLFPHLSLYGLLLVVIGLLMGTRFRAIRNPHQPRAVPAEIPIPFIGHALGLFFYRNHYYTKVSQRWKLPIFSLPMFGGNVYVVQSPDLIYSLQRQPKSLSFWFFEIQFSIRLGGLNQTSADTLFRGITPGSSDANVVVESLKDTKLVMSPQAGMYEMNQIAAKAMKTNLDKLQQKGKQVVDMAAWIQHEITVATTEAVYGQGNPYRDPKVETGFWDFANAATMIALPESLAKLLAPKGLAGRETVAKAIEHYYASDHLKNASQLARARYASLKGHIEDNDVARSECIQGLAILANSAPAAFWACFHMYSDPELLQKIRDQVEKITTAERTDGADIRKINIRKLKDAPLLFSLIQETLRYRARGTGPRMVMEDVIVSDDQREYHLEKSSVVIIAHNAMHLNSDAWGDTASEFVAERFLPGNKIPAVAFRGFGGGANMCPGKGFAMAEIAALLSMLAMRFDLIPAAGGWSEPGQDLSNITRENTPPLKEVMVEIVSRPGTEHEEWTFDM